MKGIWLSMADVTKAFQRGEISFSKAVQLAKDIRSRELEGDSYCQSSEKREEFTMKIYPEFIVAAYLINQGCEADPKFLDTEEGMEILLEMIRHAPPNFHDQLRAKLLEVRGPLPKPHGFGDDGKPLFLPSQIAAWAGTTESYVKEHLEELQTEYGEDYYHRGPVHPCQ
ncbi:MAG: hypothetical protein HQL75_01080 [Magnetococcales bacterium]|nr:hypothetical protein [Magnetococcales bacterium]